MVPVGSADWFWIFSSPVLLLPTSLLCPKHRLRTTPRGTLEVLRSVHRTAFPFPPARDRDPASRFASPTVGGRARNSTQDSPTFLRSGFFKCIAAVGVLVRKVALTPPGSTRTSIHTLKRGGRGRGRGSKGGGRTQALEAAGRPVPLAWVGSTYPHACSLSCTYLTPCLFFLLFHCL